MNFVRKTKFGAMAAISAFGCIVAFGNMALADEGEDMDDVDAAVMHVLEDYDIAIGYDYIATLMRLPNAFGEGAACVVCHTSNDPKKSPNGLDLTSCEGIKKGSVHGPMIVPGKHYEGTFRRRMRDNRMPLGVRFDVPKDMPAMQHMKQWIANGAKNDELFKTKVLPSFKDPNAYGGEQSCVECHMSNQEPPSFHELDLTSHKGVMLGADAVAKAAEGLPPVKVVIPGKPMESRLYLRVTENRMPGGIGADQSRDHPNMHVMFRWIDQGAKCN